MPYEIPSMAGKSYRPSHATMKAKCFERATVTVVCTMIQLRVSTIPMLATS